jgi:hypothetical protein
MRCGTCLERTGLRPPGNSKPPSISINDSRYSLLALALSDILTGTRNLLRKQWNT